MCADEFKAAMSDLTADKEQELRQHLTFKAKQSQT